MNTMKDTLKSVKPVRETRLPLPLFRKGKVRETYVLDDTLLMVASDRISAFDVVFNEGIPLKGIVLTQLSLFWFDLLKEKHHLIKPAAPKDLVRSHPELAFRSMVVQKLSIIPIECVVRGYLAGSALKEYQQTGSVCGIKLPPGLVNSSQLPQPIFTPATKELQGHDINITPQQARDIVKRATGADLYDEMEAFALRVYQKAATYAQKRGVILADTKFEFGISDGTLVLADEVLTPDSSRFWPASSYTVGKNQPSYDKQYVRDYLESLGWNKNPPPPPLPEDVVLNTAAKYCEIYKILTGKDIFDVIAKPEK